MSEKCDTISVVIQQNTTKRNDGEEYAHPHAQHREGLHRLQGSPEALARKFAPERLVRKAQRAE
jgi:hypothetical protein